MAANRTLRGEISAKAPYSWQGETMTAPFVSRAINCQGANSEFVKIVGGTVAWNQLCEHGNFDATTGWNKPNDIATQTASDNVLTRVAGPNSGPFSNTLSRTAASPFVAGHKVLMACSLWCDSANQARARYPFIGSTQSFSANTWYRFETIGEVNESYKTSIGIQCDLISGGTYKYRDFIVFDLTAMLGPTIADYVYSLEQATAGSGIAWLKSYGFFTEDYYPYSATSLESVQTSAHVIKDANDQTVETYPIDDVILRGIPKLADGEMYFDGDTYEWDGTVTRKYGIHTFDGTENWQKSSTYDGSFYLNTGVHHTRNENSSISNMALFNRSLPTNYAYGQFGYDGANNTNVNIWIMPAGKTKEEFKQYLAGLYAAGNPLEILYELPTASQTTESADPYTNPITIDPNGSESWVDAGTRDFDMPVGNETSYAGLYPDLGLSPLGLKAQITLVDPFA